MATVVRLFTADSSPLVTTSVSTTGVCETDWMSVVLPAAKGPVTRSLNTCSMRAPASSAMCSLPSCAMTGAVCSPVHQVAAAPFECELSVRYIGASSHALERGHQTTPHHWLDQWLAAPTRPTGIVADGRVPERPKGHASKACEVQASVGSNPTPSAPCSLRWVGHVHSARQRGQEHIVPSSGGSRSIRYLLTTSITQLLTP